MTVLQRQQRKRCTHCRYCDTFKVSVVQHLLMHSCGCTPVVSNLFQLATCLLVHLLCTTRIGQGSKRILIVTEP